MVRTARSPRRPRRRSNGPHGDLCKAVVVFKRTPLTDVDISLCERHALGLLNARVAKSLPPPQLIATREPRDRARWEAEIARVALVFAGARERG